MSPIPGKNSDQTLKIRNPDLKTEGERKKTDGVFSGACHPCTTHPRQGRWSPDGKYTVMLACVGSGKAQRSQPETV